LKAVSRRLHGDGEAPRVSQGRDSRFSAGKISIRSGTSVQSRAGPGTGPRRIRPRPRPRPVERPRAGHIAGRPLVGVCGCRRFFLSLSPAISTPAGRGPGEGRSTWPETAIGAAAPPFNAAPHGIGHSARLSGPEQIEKNARVLRTARTLPHH